MGNSNSKPTPSEESKTKELEAEISELKAKLKELSPVEVAERKIVKCSDFYPAKFEVSIEQLPGLARDDIGFRKPGEKVTWPEEAKLGDNPSIKMIPLNQKAYDLLCAIYGVELVNATHGELVKPKEEEKPIVPRTAGNVRASDSM